MAATRDRGLIFEFGIVLAIYAAFILAYLLFRGFFDVIFAQYVAVGTIVTASVLLFYRAYMKKQIAIFISGFTVIGILLLTLSTIITVPFKTTETLLSTRSVNWYDDTISLNPRESMNLSLPDLWPSPTLAANGTVIQLKISNIGGLTVKLYYRAHAYQGEKLGLNESFGNAGPTELGTRWLNIYWAPVGPIGESLYPDATRGQASYIITINLENLEDSQEQVMFKVNFYDFAATTEREHITYRPAIDYYFGYLGVTLLTASAVLELSDLQRRRTHGSLLKEKSTSV